MNWRRFCLVIVAPLVLAICVGITYYSFVPTYLGMHMAVIAMGSMIVLGWWSIIEIWSFDRSFIELRPHALRTAILLALLLAVCVGLIAVSYLLIPPCEVLKI